jgi:predicted HAD superfamily Cof-like phosphohydrolase
MSNNTQTVKSDAVLVKEFTVATGYDIPKEPQKMNKDQVHFIVKMMIDEIKELMATVEKPEEYKKTLINLIDHTKDVERPFETMSDEEIIAEQHDAFVDSYYYTLNCAAKNGVNMSKIFNLVHQANMAKKDPESGLFNRRADGKIIKPPGWIEPDIVGEIKSQIKNGAWN